MEARLKMYCKGEKFWVGKLVDHPEVMTQGETLKELEENIVDAHKLPVLDEVPEDHETKGMVVAVRGEKN
jgi:predicted RNase H-like HicB family nuclease